ncbi:MAG: tRNA (adenosine(37)-N6)-threonylcarbamoyltransferase complex ATPase subunit type 1 TsaE [Limibacillus sp.]|jgi:tRNA threonylcarbamoyladenosine biosynthesis protein TsaE
MEPQSPRPVPPPEVNGVYRCTGEAETAALAAALAPLLRPGDILALRGDLGAGKTAFARALLNALPHPDGTRGPEEVPSPSFTLVQTYERAAGPVWHIDLYRLERPEDCWELGLEEAFAEAISLIEWPERLGPLLPEHALSVRMEIAEDSRHVRLEGPDPWPARLAEAGLTAAR